MRHDSRYASRLGWGIAGYALVTLWAIGRALLGAGPLPWLTIALTGIAFVLALLHAGRRLGWRDALLFWAVTFAVSLAFESVGVLTGRVYGPYHYTSRLGPKIFGLVPLAIPVAWFMMTYPSFVLAQWVTPRTARGWRRFTAQAAITGLVMTAWDLAMDPMMVQSGHWVWETRGAYFGVPVQNFVGWWVTVAVTVVLFQALAPTRTLTLPTDGAFDRLCVPLYLITAGGNLVAAWLSDLRGPVLVGVFAMLPWLLTSWWAMSSPGTPAD